MGIYLNPADEVPSKGRRLERTAFADLMRELRQGEVLVGLYDRAIRRVAPILDSEAKHGHFYSQYYAGGFISYAYYAVPRTTAIAMSGGALAADPDPASQTKER